MDERAQTQKQLAETHELLVSMSRQRFGAIPEQLIVDHILSVTQDADFPVRKGALEALLRRQGFARRDELRVASRPARSAVLGEYTTRGSSQAQPNSQTKRPSPGKGGQHQRGRGRPTRKPPRPYLTRLYSVEPLRGSCTCQDFLRGSLGLCKHLLVALDDVYAKPRRLAAARLEQRRNQAAVQFDRAAGFLNQVRVLMQAPAVPEAAPIEDRPPEAPVEPEDDDAPQALEVEAEPRDSGLVQHDQPPASPSAAAGPPSPQPAPPPPGEAGPASGDIAALFGSVQVRRTASGGLTLEAPPEAAASLAALFEGMAKLLAQSARAG